MIQIEAGHFLYHEPPAKLLAFRATVEGNPTQFLGLLWQAEHRDSGDEDQPIAAGATVPLLQFAPPCGRNPHPIVGAVKERDMAQRCEICGKGPMTGSKISHAHNVTKRRWLPNLQRVRAMVDGRPKYIRVCTRCLRSGKVVKAPRL
jgi:large subunit ribosomal protein L28